MSSSRFLKEVFSLFIYLFSFMLYLYGFFYEQLGKVDRDIRVIASLCFDK